MENLANIAFSLFHFPKSQHHLSSPSSTLFKLREQSSNLEKIKKAERLLKFKSEGRLTVFLSHFSGLLTQIYFMNHRSWLSDEILAGVQIVKEFEISEVESSMGEEESAGEEEGEAEE